MLLDNGGRVFWIPGLLRVYPYFDITLWTFLFSKRWYYSDVVAEVRDARTAGVCLLDSHDEGTVVSKLPL
jgi:hypothetical protein